MLACCTVAATLVTCNRVGGIRKWLGYAAVMDISFTVLLLVAFSGTFAGMVVATLAGLILAIVLSALKKILGYDRLALKSGRLVWVHHAAAWEGVKMPRVKFTVE